MADIKVGDPVATIRAVETFAGSPVVVVNPLNFSIQPNDGSVASIAEGPTPETVLLTPVAAGTAVVSVEDVRNGLSASLTVVVTGSGGGVTADAIELQFEPGGSSPEAISAARAARSRLR